MNANIHQSPCAVDMLGKAAIGMAAPGGCLPFRAPEAAEQPFDPRCGTWLDHDLRLTGDEGVKLFETVIAALGAPPRRSHHRAHFERRVECIIANALRVRFYRESDRVAYRRGTIGALGMPKWQSIPSMRATVDLMANAGLLETEGGVWGGNIQGPGRASTYWAAAPLRKAIKSSQVDEDNIRKPAPTLDDLIELRGGKDGKRGLPFEATEETNLWTVDLDRYNRFAEPHEIWLDVDTKEEKALVAAQNAKVREAGRYPGITQPELFNRHLRRIFNDGTFDHGGRLYGAWYQYVPGWWRKRIAIDESDTVELDFSGMSLRIIYHQRGIDYRDDPYAIPELEGHAERQGFARGHYRGSVKQLTQAMLNNDDEGCLPEMIKKLEQSFQPKYTRAQVRDMILAKHDPIRDVFDPGGGHGKRCNRLDSDIALDVIVSLMEKSILCLPVHDSFIVKDVHRPELHDQMITSYRNRLGFDPIIK